MTRFTTTYVSALPILLLLAGCGNDLENRNAALGLEEDGASDIVLPRQKSSSSNSARQINGLGEVEQVSDDFATVDDPEAGPNAGSIGGDGDDEPVIIDASPEDLRDIAQGFAPEPIDDASGLDPRPIAPAPLSD